MPKTTTMMCAPDFEGHVPGAQSADALDRDHPAPANARAHDPLAPAPRSPRALDLMFLLTLAPMATACPGDDTSAQTTSDSSGEVSPTPSDATTTGLTPPVDGTTGAPAPSDDSTSSGTTVDAVDSTSSSGTTTETTPSEETTIGDESEPCVAFGRKAGECIDPQAEDFYEEYCQTYRDDYVEGGSADCVAAFDEMIVCLSSLSCEQWRDDGLENSCPEQTALQETACAPPGGTGS